MPSWWRTGRRGRNHTRSLDVLDADAVEAAIDGVGRIDILFNCAGVVHGGAIPDMAEDDLDFDLNLEAIVITTRAELPARLAAGDGCIINMASVAQSIKGVPNRFAYGTSKAAVIGMTKTVAADYVALTVRRFICSAAH